MMLVVPMGIVGSLLAITLRGLENDIYFQVALLTIVGLSAKKRHSDRRVRRGNAPAR